MSRPRESRPPVAWATHSMQILMVLSVIAGGALFGFAFAMWPQSSFDRWFGSAILAAVTALGAWSIWYLLRPVERG